MLRAPLLAAATLLAASLAMPAPSRAATVQQADIDQDGVVSIFDLALVANSYPNRMSGRVDVDGDGVVSVLDLASVAQHFGKRAGAPAGTRDKLKQPFASTSIWNMPLGSSAHYTSIGFRSNLDWSTVDEDVIVMAPGAPQRDLFVNGVHGPGRCAQSGLNTRVPIPDAYLVPDATDVWRPNHAGAFLMPDGRTIVQTNATARCAAGSAVTAATRASNADIYGDGIAGGHGGSGMSSVGGSIRLGELFGSAPIRHALKVNINCLRYCSQDNGGHRWPAPYADLYALGANGYGRQGLSVPGLGMGSLLALSPALNINALGLETAAGAKLAWTLQNYGAYVVDDAYDPNGVWNVIAWDAERGVDDELFSSVGYRLDANTGPLYRDVIRIVTALQMVDNNGPSSVGGGGTPRQPLAPAIGN